MDFCTTTSGLKPRFGPLGLRASSFLAFFVVVQRLCCIGEKADEKGEETKYEALASEEEVSKGEPGAESESAKQKEKPAVVEEKTH